jgi:DNA-binding transcriptional regulator GbsR (MarR family)
MTEISDINKALPAAIERFVVHWGEMGEMWGVNRSVAQVHALLFVSDQPMTAEDIAARLGIARSNVSTSLKELTGWTLIRRVQVLGDRRDYFEAEADMFEMVRRIALGRKAREIDPTLAVLRSCVSDATAASGVSLSARKRLGEMLQFMETVDKSFDELMRLPPPVLNRMIKMGGTLARLVSAKPKSSSKRN